MRHRLSRFEHGDALSSINIDGDVMTAEGRGSGQVAGGGGGALHQSVPSSNDARF